MKTKSNNPKSTLILSSLLLTMVLLTSCKPFKKQTPEAVPTNTAKETTEAKPSVDDTAAAPTAKPKIYSASDQAAYAGALELKDAEFCNKVTDESYQTECKTAVADRVTLESAVSNSDSTDCAKLSSEDAKRACEINIEVDQEKAAKLKAEEEAKAAGNKLAQEIVDAKDINRCKELAIESQQLDCELMILINKATAQQDVSICQQGSTQEARDICKTSTQRALSKLQ